LHFAFPSTIGIVSLLFRIIMSRIAVAQMVSSTNVEANLRQAGSLIEQAAQNQAKLLVLPENFAFMGHHETDKLRVAEEFGTGPIQSCMSDFARQNKLWIIAGTIPIKINDDRRVHSRLIVFDDNGEQVAFYDKIHLFDVRVSDVEAHKESDSVMPGDKVVCVDTPVARIGLSVCYDLRFPELYRQLTEQGAELLVAPSAFTKTTGKAHWQILLRARAIENLCYVAAANQGGRHENTRETFGHSMIVEPWGSVLESTTVGQDLIISELDLNRLHKIRKQFPCNQHHILRG
jgi:predicted amidohydrolase